MAILGVLTVRVVKAGCSFEVVSGVSGKFGDPYNTKAPSSSVFDGNLARNETSRATLWALWAYRIALVVARCKIFGSLAQPFGHFGRIGSLSLWRIANFESQGGLVQRS